MSAPREDETASGYAALLVLCTCCIGAAAVLSVRGSPAFGPYFGDRAPVVSTLFVAALAVAALAVLRRRGFAIRDPVGTRAGLGRAILFATAFALPVVLVDLLGGFPADINVESPESWLFYPSIAFVAETVFHAAPLALLLGIAWPLAGRAKREHIVWICIVLTALIEPTFQVVSGSGRSPTWATAYVGVHVLAINLTGLYLFKRHDFMTMYTFRAIYYVYWHILWGMLRLRLLF